MLNCQQDFHIIASTDAVVDNIGGSTIYTVLSMSVLNEKGCQEQRKKD